MKSKKYKEKYSKKAAKKKVAEKKLVDIKWVLTITILAFVISILFSGVSQTLIPNINVIFSVLLVLVVILLGVIFDMVGISATVADPKTFHSMATKRVRGARVAIKLINKADKVSSFCNDVIGDICGIVSGSAGAAISLILASKLNVNILVVSLPITALIAALTIGGKAIGKSFAVNKGTDILYKFSLFLSYFIGNK